MSDLEKDVLFEQLPLQELQQQIQKLKQNLDKLHSEMACTNAIKTRLQIMDSLSETGHIVINLEGKIIHTNPAAIKILETDKESLENTVIHHYIRIDSQYNFADYIKNLSEKKEPIACLFKLKSNNKDIELSGQLSPDEQTYIFVITDLTEKKKHYKAVKKLRRCSFDITNCGQNPLIVLNKQMQIVMVNNYFCQMFQTNLANIEGIELNKIQNKQWKIPRLQKSLQKLVQGETEEEQFEISHYFQFLGQRQMSIRTTCSKDESIELDFIIISIQDITQEQQLKNDLRETAQLFQAFLSKIPVCMLRTDRQGKIVKALGPGLEKRGLNAKELIDINIYDIFPHIEDYIKKGLMKDSVTFVDKVVHQEREYYFQNYIFPDSDRHFGVIYIAQDITEFKEVQKQLEAAKDEKKVLTKAFHHRISNNLHLIASLLSAQSKYIGDSAVQNMLSEHKQRLHSMELIHNQLSHSHDNNEIDMAKYIRTLTNHLLKTTDKNITINIDVSNNSKFLVELAMPCGVIVNELVLNSIKHGFVGRNEGEINVGLFSPNNQLYTLVVADNGIGFPEEINFNDFESFGVQLVNILVKQLGGDLQLIRQSGTKFFIKFAPNTVTEKRDARSQTRQIRLKDLQKLLKSSP